MAAKRILVLTNRVPYPLNDGGNMAMHAMVYGYHTNGWEVFLLSMNTTRHYVAVDRLKKIYTDIHAFDTVDIDNEIHLWPTFRNFLFSREPNHADRFRDKQFANRLTGILRSFRPHLVHVESVYLSTYLPLIRENSGAKTVLRLHNIEYQIWERLASETKKPMHRVYLKSLAKRIRNFEEKEWNEYDYLLPITEADEQVVKQAGVTRPTYVVPFSIDIDQNQSKAGEEQWVAYHIGAMDWLPNKEGIEWFLYDAWPVIRAKCPDFRFSFAGRNMPGEFKRANIQGVQCMGEVADANAFISGKKILIVPIQSGGGIRVKVLEAMAAGKIVISTGIGMQGIHATDKEHYLLADTEQEFADAVRWCLDNKEQAEAMVSRARQFVMANYDKNKVSRGLSVWLQAQLPG